MSVEINGLGIETHFKSEDALQIISTILKKVEYRHFLPREETEGTVRANKKKKLHDDVHTFEIQRKNHFEFHSIKLGFGGQCCCFFFAHRCCCSANRNKEANGVCVVEFVCMYMAGFHIFCGVVYRKCFWMACNAWVCVCVCAPKAHHTLGWRGVCL